MLKELVEGMALGFTNKEVKEAAKQFMRDNGYHLTPEGKSQAITDLQNNEYVQEKYPQNLIYAVATAISTL